MKNRIKFFFSKDNRYLELVSEIIFFIYIVWVTIPFISSKVQLLRNITSIGNFAIVYRAIGSFLFTFFFSLVALINKFKINKPYLIVSGLLLLANIIGTIVLPNSVIYGDGTIYNDSFLTNNHFFHISEYTVGYLSILKGFFRIGFGLVFGYILFFIVPNLVEKKFLVKISIFYIFILLLCCFLSVILELPKFKSKNFLKLNLSSIFVSKNDFGSFLIIGSFACLYLLQIGVKFYKFLYIVLDIFLFFSIVCGCKTSLFFALIIFIYLYCTTVKKIGANNRVLGKVFKILGVLSIVIIFIFFILLLTNASPIFSELKQKVDFALSHDVAYTLITRFQIWSLSFKNTNLFKILFGQTWSYGPQQLYASTSFSIGTGFTSYHNSFIMIYSVSGLMGLIFYIFLIVKCIRIATNFKNIKMRSFLLLLLFGLLIFSFVEDDLVFISGSGFSLYYSLMLSPIGKEKGNKKDYIMEVKV